MPGGTDEPPPRIPLLQKLQKLQDDVSTDSSSCSIFKVPKHLHQLSEKAYEPQVISIGPYHRGKDQLQTIEVHKMFYLKKLLKRTESSLESSLESRLERCKSALKDNVEKARKSYSEPLDHIGGEEFVEMMLLDGCFIIELIRKSAMEKLKDENDHFLTDSILRRVMRDLLLIENQLPFCILSELFDKTVMPDDEAKDFIGIAIEFFSKIMPGSLGRPHKKQEDIKHLLDLLHASCCQAPSDSQEVRISCTPEKVIRSLCSKAKLKAMAIPCLSSPSKSAEEDQEMEIVPSASDTNSKEWRFIRSATELSKAGINFKKIEGRLFDIKFQEGVMSIPTLKVDYDTESLLRNLVAYEQFVKGASSKSFTNYVTFMDRLINTRKDVELLSHRDVIDNWLGNHGVVAAIFNKLCDYVLISEEDFSYAETFKKVNTHCDKNWNHWKAKLWHNYFNTPWGAISIFAAVFLLLFTVLQSVYSVLSYHFQ